MWSAHERDESRGRMSRPSACACTYGELKEEADLGIGGDVEAVHSRHRKMLRRGGAGSRESQS